MSPLDRITTEADLFRWLHLLEHVLRHASPKGERG